MEGKFELFIEAIKSGLAELFGRYFKDEYLEQEDDNKKRVIHIACKYGRKDIVKLLIDHNCDIEARDKYDWRPIHHACWDGHMDIARLLIDHNCDIEANNQLDQRPIHNACKNGKTDTVKLLIDHNCDIEARDHYDWRPVHYACWDGHRDIVKLLCDHNCDIKARNQSDESPMDIAVNKNDNELIGVIKSAILEFPLEQQISKMGLKCESGCDHKLCPKSLRDKTFDKGSKIGQGSFGFVYKLKGSGISSEFAIKRLKLDGVEEKYIEGNIDKFLPKLNHERIVKYFGAIKTKKDLCIFMEFFPRAIIHIMICHHPEPLFKYPLQRSWNCRNLN